MSTKCVPSLVSLLSSMRPDVSIAAVVALQQLCENDADNIVAANYLGTTDKISLLAQSGDSELSESCSVLIAQLCGEARAAPQLHRSQMPGFSIDVAFASSEESDGPASMHLEPSEPATSISAGMEQKQESDGLGDPLVGSLEETLPASVAGEDEEPAQGILSSYASDSPDELQVNSAGYLTPNGIERLDRDDGLAVSIPSARTKLEAGSKVGVYTLLVSWVFFECRENWYESYTIFVEG